VKIRPAVSAENGAEQKKEGKEREGTLSHKCVIFHLIVEQTPLDRSPRKLAWL